jgi:hypothetical protein
MEDCMGDTFVISGLIRRHAELAGEIEHTQHRVKQLITNLEALNTTIRLFDPDYYAGMK